MRLATRTCSNDWTMNSGSSNKVRLRRQAPQRAASAGQAGRRQTPESPPSAGQAGLRPVHLLILGTTCAASAGALLAHGTSVPNIAFVVLTVVAAGVAAGTIYRTLSPLTAEAITG